MEEVVEDGAFKESRLRQCQKPAYLQDTAVKNCDPAPGAGFCLVVMGSADGLWALEGLLTLQTGHGSAKHACSLVDASSSDLAISDLWSAH